MNVMDMKGTLAIIVAVLVLSGCAKALSEQCALPATGQNDWYDNEGKVAKCDDSAGFDGPQDVPPGQDGRLMAGCPIEGRFVAEGGVVTDTCTDLMWLRGASGPMTWADALVSTRDLTFAGFDDWRLPNVNELLSIVDYGRAFPAIDPAVFEIPGGEITVERPLVFWSSTSSHLVPKSAWTVNFEEGSHEHLVKGSLRSVRAVRGGVIPVRSPERAIPACTVIGP